MLRFWICLIRLISIYFMFVGFFFFCCCKQDLFFYYDVILILYVSNWLHSIILVSFSVLDMIIFPNIGLSLIWPQFGCGLFCICVSGFFLFIFYLEYFSWSLISEIGAIIVRFDINIFLTSLKNWECLYFLYSGTV